MVSLIDPKRFNLDTIAARLEGARHLAEEVSFEAFALRDMEAVLQTCLSFNRDVPEYEQYEIVRAGIFRAGERGPITPEALLQSLSTLEKAYLSTRPEAFLLLTSLSMTYGRHLRRVQWRDAEIRFYSRFPRHLQRVPKKAAINWPQSLIPEQYVPVTVAVRARGPHEAYAKAIDRLDYVRGIWNFALNRRFRTRIFSEGSEPINRITLGPYRTIYKASGVLALQTFWEVPNHQLIEPSVLARTWARVTRESGAINRTLARHPYGRVLRHVFLRYVRALDSSDFEVAFLKLWAILEYLTETTARYEDTIRRTLFLMRDVEVQRVILEHLRHLRNVMVHEGRSAAEIEAYMLQLKRYVEIVIGFHIRTGGKFPSLSDAAKFLSLPRDPTTLQKQLRYYRLALQEQGA